MQVGRFVDTQKEPVHIRERRLPHWTADEAIYFVTFRLADSLPQAYLARLRCETERISGIPDLQSRDRERRQLLREAETNLDLGLGRCVLRHGKCAEVVRDALHFFDGERYDLFAYTVMPNHVHVLVHPRADVELYRILKSWKAFTSRRINALVGKQGRLWQPESFDHLVRTESQFERFTRYILDNPKMAGLTDWPWPWSDSEIAGEGSGI